MSKIDLNNPEDVQKELEKIVKDKFGSNIQVITQAFDQFGQNLQDQSNEEPQSADEDIEEKNSLDDILTFSEVPKSLKAKLDEYVISQDEAKKTLAIAICDHYNQVKYYNSLSKEEKLSHTYSKQNVLLLGPTGVGKTYMVKQLAKELGVPFVKADATKYSETGYMGANVEDLIKDLVKQADDDLNKAEFGIVYIDEADKLATQNSKHHGKDVNGRGVQLGLLKMMEETDVDLRSGNDPSSHMQTFMEMQSSGGKLPEKIINTRNILFILSGAFTGLEEVIGKRLSKTKIGFGAGEQKQKIKEQNMFSHVSTEDLVEFGLEPEFVGRIPVRVSCEHLSPDDLYTILKESKGSVLSQYYRSFGAYGINIEFTECALREIAERAHKQNTGARSLMTIIESALRDFKFHLPSSNIKRLKVDADLINEPKRVLNSLLEESESNQEDLIDQIRSYEKAYLAKYDIAISFSDEAISNITKAVESSHKDVHEFLDQTLVGYESGLKSILKNIGGSGLTLPGECISAPQETLAGWVKSSYSRAGFSVPPEEDSTVH